MKNNLSLADNKQSGGPQTILYEEATPYSLIANNIYDGFEQKITQINNTSYNMYLTHDQIHISSNNLN